MGLIDAEGQGITLETLSRYERRRYEHAESEAKSCKNLHQIEAYAYAALVKGFSECFITGGGSIGDADITMLVTFSGIFDPADLPVNPWDDISEEQFRNTHKLFRTPWIARAIDALGYERFHSLVLQAVAATRDIVAEQASYCDDDLAFFGYHERESLVHEEMVKHYPVFADVFNPYPSVDDCDYDWAAEESIKIIAAAAYTVNHTATTGPRASNPSPTPRRQTGGSDSDDSASDDHDSHVLDYHKYNQKTLLLTCWTSALEVVTAAIPAAKTIQKQTRHIGNCRLELAYYPPDFAPDYTFHTLIRAALEVGYTSGPGALSQSLQSTVGVASHPLWPLYNRFGLNNITLDDDLDLTTIARQRDPDGVWYKIAARAAWYACHAWAADLTHGDDIVQDVTTSTYISLLKRYDPERGYYIGSYASIWARSYLRDTLARQKFCIPRGEVKKCKNLAEQLLARHLDDAPAVDDAGYDVWEHRRRRLAADVEKYQANIGGLVVVAPSSLDVPMSDAEDSISVVETLSGDQQDTMTSTLHSQSVAAVEYLLAALKDSQMREVFVSKHVHNLKTGEISSLYGITQDAVRKYLRKAQQIMQQAAADRGIRGEDYY